MREQNPGRRGACGLRKTYFVCAAAVLSLAGCAGHTSHEHGNLGHHGSNEDQKRAGAYIAELDQFIDRWTGRYRSDGGALVFCRVLVKNHTRALVLERSVGDEFVERRLWLVEPSERMDQLQEHELRPASPSSVCHELPMELDPDAVGPPLRAWHSSLEREGEQGRAEHAFLHSTIDGEPIRYERTTERVMRVEGRTKEEYRLLRGRPGASPR